MTPRVTVSICRISGQVSRKCRNDQCAKQLIDFLWAEWAVAFHPPIEHENKRRGNVLHKKVRGNPARRFAATAKHLADVIGNQISENLLEEFVNDRPSLLR